MKMNKLSSNNQNDIQYYENMHWEVIDKIKWYYLARDYGNEANDKLAEFLIENNFSIEEIVELHNFVVKQREIVKNFISGFLRGCPSYLRERYKLSDDGTWDLASHIVGMGKQMMDVVLGNPDIIFVLQKIKVENFEYGFDKAMYEIQNK